MQRFNVDALDVFLVGAGLCSYGAWQVYGPAGYIVAGVLLLILVAWKL